MHQLFRSLLHKVTSPSQRAKVHSFLVRHYENTFPSAERDHIKPSFSAWGEDLVVAAWLGIKRIPLNEVRYLDIGAAYPVFLSNSYLFYRSGASGVLVEPDPGQSALLRETRPRDTVVAAGVTDRVAGSAKFIQMSSPVFSTFSTDGANKVVEQSKGWEPNQLQSIIGETNVEMIPINDVLSRHFSAGPLHFVSIDVEGMELALIQNIDFSRFQPAAICVEASEALSVFVEILGHHGYQLVAQTPDNFVFFKV